MFKNINGYSEDSFFNIETFSDNKSSRRKKVKEGFTSENKIENAKKNIQDIPMAGSTIVHSIIGKHGSSRVLLKPAAPGTGVIAGGAARQVLEVAGVKDILAKSLGSPTHLNVAKATINGLLNQRTPDMVAGLRGKKPSEVAPAGLVEAYEKTKAEKKVKVADES